jgi:hypothetical protein
MQIRQRFFSVEEILDEWIFEFDYFQLIYFKSNKLTRTYLYQDGIFYFTITYLGYIIKLL